MGTTPRLFSIAIMTSALAVAAAGQTAPTAPQQPEGELQQSPSDIIAPQASPAPAASSVPAVPSVPANSAVPAVSSPPATADVAPAVQLLRGFRDSDVKFDLSELMDILRDRRHEGWVLSAYPDPKTGRPLIGAGFSLDLPAREHSQLDPLNPHPFLEPASAELWQAAGLDPNRLQTILDQYHVRFAAWSKLRYRKKIGSLDPQISDDDATRLLRVAAIQAIYNAKAYCRYFDQLTASQQMAMSQLVYQMGVNLQEFTQFLNLVNGSVSAGADQAALSLRNAAASDAKYWKAVQESLIHSQWARLYRTRAVAVIAMLDPEYSDHPSVAEHRVGATLRPAVVHRRRGRARSSRQLASDTGHSGHAIHRRSSHTRTRRTA
ncbi:MAG: hypothetical protein WBE76_02755 [Terracidiphilus sp.]